MNELIEAQNTKQIWLAEKAGVLQQTLSQWILKDRLPDAQTAFRIAQALETTAEYLVTGKAPAGIAPDVLAIARQIAALTEADRQEILALTAYKLSKYPPLENSSHSPKKSVDLGSSGS